MPEQEGHSRLKSSDLSENASFRLLNGRIGVSAYHLTLLTADLFVSPSASDLEDRVF